MRDIGEELCLDSIQVLLHPDVGPQSPRRQEDFCKYEQNCHSQSNIDELCQKRSPYGRTDLHLDAGDIPHCRIRGDRVSYLEDILSGRYMRICGSVSGSRYPFLVISFKLIGECPLTTGDEVQR